MARKENWTLALQRVTRAASNLPHAWGSHDCVTFGADCVLAMTGSDPIENERGTYATAHEAARIVKDAGCESLGDLVAQRLPEIQVAYARRGDAVLCEGPEGVFIAICDGHTAVGPSRHGLVHVPMSQALRAYQVG
ncbi:MAG: hypothetical protein AAGL19_03450 [Pseudomonadota bacterium]